MDRQRLTQISDVHRTGLLEDVIPFWERHSVDREQGGFLTHLDRDGSIYSTDKPVWVQARATWMFATLYARVEPRAEWLALARHGYDFLTRHCFDERGKMYFLVTRDGRPLRMRRYVYSEIFGTLAFAALAQATGEPEIRQRAIELFQAFTRYLKTPGLIEPKTNPRTRPLKALSPLMCILNTADTLVQIDAPGPYERILDETIAEIFRDFARPEDGCVLEVVEPDGQRSDTLEGRTMNPGHAIESAWFIMEVARRRGDAELARRATKILDWSFERGWDQQYGGLVYFVDVGGRPPQQLEHDMKLWWPHSEALYAALLAHHLTGEARYAQMYDQIHAWTLAHFPDAQYGEWFGYLHRDGTVSNPAKGGMWKGPFHIPRQQLYCWKLAEEMLAQARNR